MEQRPTPTVQNDATSVGDEYKAVSQPAEVEGVQKCFEKIKLPIAYKLKEAKGRISIEEKKKDPVQEGARNVRGMIFKYVGDQQVHWLQTLQLYIRADSGQYIGGKVLYFGSGESLKSLSTPSSRVSYVDAGYTGEPFLDEDGQMSLTDPSARTVGFFDPPLEGGKDVTIMRNEDSYMPSKGAGLTLIVKFLTRLVTVDGDKRPEHKLITILWTARRRLQLAETESETPESESEKSDTDSEPQSTWLCLKNCDAKPDYSVWFPDEHSPVEDALADPDDYDAYTRWVEGAICLTERQLKDKMRQLGEVEGEAEYEEDEEDEEGEEGEDEKGEDEEGEENEDEERPWNG